MSADIQKLGMPKWGLSMTEGRLVAWLIDEGSEVAVGDEVAEVETDKLNGAVESPVAGVLRRHVASAGETIPVGGLLAVVADAEATDADVDAFVAEFQASFVPGESDEDAGPEPETVEVGAGTLRYLRQGEGGDAVVLLHGFGGDLNNWLFAAPALATSVSERARPGSRSAVLAATRPPSEWPTRCTRSSSTASRNWTTASTRKSTSPGPTSFDEPPCPGSSRA